ncbi:MAG: carbohydrate kinase, partial [bacterium]
LDAAATRAVVPAGGSQRGRLDRGHRRPGPGLRPLRRAACRPLRGRVSCRLPGLHGGAMRACRPRRRWRARLVQ